MIGRTWTWESAVPRLSAVAPLAALPLYRLLDGRLPAAAGFALVGAAIGWCGFVAARVALNEHRERSAVLPFRPLPDRTRR